MVTTTLISVAVTGGVFSAVVWLLGPVVSRLSRTSAWDHRHWKQQHTESLELDSKVPFVPLDLGPVNMSWPSKRPWGFGSGIEPDWPSAAWDDPQFGRQKDEEALVIRSSVQAQLPPPEKSTPSPDPSPAQPQPLPGQVIRAAELEDLVAQLGLAGTVEHVMSKTGLGFKEAARMISMVRGRR